MNVASVSSSNNVSMGGRKFKITSKIVEKANEKTMGNKSNSDVKRVRGYGVSSIMDNNGDIHFDIKNLWGETVAEITLTKEKINEAFSKAFKNL